MSLALKIYILISHPVLAVRPFLFDSFQKYVGGGGGGGG